MTYGTTVAMWKIDTQTHMLSKIIHETKTKGNILNILLHCACMYTTELLTEQTCISVFPASDIESAFESIRFLMARE